MQEEESHVRKMFETHKKPSIMRANGQGEFILIIGVGTKEPLNDSGSLKYRNQLLFNIWVDFRQ